MTYLASLTFDTIDAGAQLATLLVVAAATIAAVRQVRHLRASNELEALLTLTEQLRQPDLQRAFLFVQTELDERLTDRAFRQDLSRRGYVDARMHPEMDACNWFDQVGALVKNRLIHEGTFLDLFNRLVTYYWGRLEPVIALLRRERGSGQYENFEFLAQLAFRWQTKHPHGTYPSRVARIPVADPWLASDALPPA